jgi:hypothetical protein
LIRDSGTSSSSTSSTASRARLSAQGVQGADAEDSCPTCVLKLLQDDYAVLRKYRGASSQTTFLTVVISNPVPRPSDQALGQVAPFGAKPSGMARSPSDSRPAMYRDELSFEQACQFLAKDTRFEG